MVEIVTLSCPSCGGKLEIKPNINRFACIYCGNEHVVHREGGIVTLEAVEENIQKIQLSSEKIATELAIQRLEKEIATLEKDNNLLKSYRIKLLKYYRDTESQYNLSKEVPIPLLLVLMLFSIWFGIIISFIVFGLDQNILLRILLFGAPMFALLFSVSYKFRNDKAKNTYKPKLEQARINLEKTEQEIEVRDTRIKKVLIELAQVKVNLNAGK